MTTPQQAHEAKLHELQQRITAIDADIANLDREYSDVAAQFGSDSSNGALKHAAAIETRVTNLRREKALASAAMTRIQQQQKDEQAAAEQSAKHRREQGCGLVPGESCACAAFLPLPALMQSNGLARTSEP
jgi:hypothetical protein